MARRKATPERRVGIMFPLDGQNNVLSMTDLVLLEPFFKPEKEE